jgi:large subunit ribosomal protein L9
MPLEVILTEDVPKLGRAGQVVRVKPGFARNYLLPEGKALLATSGRKADVEHKRRVIEERQKKLVSELEGVARGVQAVPLEFRVQAGEEGKLFGSVTASDIAAKLAEAGFEVDRRKLGLPEPIKQLGEYEVPLRLHPDVVAQLKVTVAAAE